MMIFFKLQSGDIYEASLLKISGTCDWVKKSFNLSA